MPILVMLAYALFIGGLAFGLRRLFPAWPKAQIVCCIAALSAFGVAAMGIGAIQITSALEAENGYRCGLWVVGYMFMTAVGTVLAAPVGAAVAMAVVPKERDEVADLAEIFGGEEKLS